MTFKVAILQSRAENSNIKRNIATIICSMKDASKHGADILLLPECFITGYDLPMNMKKAYPVKMKLSRKYAKQLKRITSVLC